MLRHVCCRLPCMRRAEVGLSPGEKNYLESFTLGAPFLGQLTARVRDAITALVRAHEKISSALPTSSAAGAVSA